ALLAGEKLAPQDKRFPLELAGVAFKQKKSVEATRYLHRAVHLDPKDTYAADFLGTTYFLEGNLEAAVKYWNRAGKPEIGEVRSVPALRVRPALFDHAFAFSPQSILTLDQLLASRARLRMLEIFSSDRFELSARSDGKFDAVFRAQEVNGFGSGKIDALLRTFGGIFFLEVTPEYYNVHGSATNIVSLLRVDSEKRRGSAGLSGPISGDPKWRYRIGADLRNENWDVQTSFTGPSTLLGSLNLRREAVAAEISRLVGARLRWSAVVEVSHRDYRSVFSGVGLTPELLLQGYQIKEIAELNYQLWRWPERRLTISSSANSQTGRIWSQPGQSFEKLQGSLELHWLPLSLGDDYEILARLKAGKTFGQLPFDELFMLGVERDNNLWLRGHEGVRNGRKGSAPLGQDYFLSNWEADKNVYSNGFVNVKLGPLFDTGKIVEPDSALGSHKWLFDAGGQAKVRLLGVVVVLSYGKDLRSGNNTFFATVAH
ncbi:MAG TPA: hypothetical protein VE133_07360, partial [Candidatus Sulfotelmatobacter sp.]|nr:hypothetical protein [Candidatus Sulfotelmatobacter sp.]